MCWIRLWPQNGRKMAGSPDASTLNVQGSGQGSNMAEFSLFSRFFRPYAASIHQNTSFYTLFRFFLPLLMFFTSPCLLLPPPPPPPPILGSGAFLSMSLTTKIEYQNTTVFWLSLMGHEISSSSWNLLLLLSPPGGGPPEEVFRCFCTWKLLLRCFLT